jgi:cytochrome b
MNENEQAKVWDLFVRVFHWTLVAAVIIALLTAEEIRWVHVRAGYLVFALVVLRIFWGFVGTRHARFSDFIYPPSEVFSYLRGLITGKAKHYVGHNPAGGWMVVALLAVLLCVTLTGMKNYGAMGHGPLAGPIAFSIAQADEDDHEHEKEYAGGRGAEGEEAHSPWQEVHETMVGILLALAGIHVAGVLASSYVHRENLIKSMFTGKKPG